MFDIARNDGLVMALSCCSVQVVYSLVACLRTELGTMRL